MYSWGPPNVISILLVYCNIIVGCFIVCMVFRWFGVTSEKLPDSLLQVWSESSSAFYFCLFCRIKRDKARYIMKSKALAPSPCGDPMFVGNGSPVWPSNFTLYCTLSSNRTIRWSSSSSIIPFKSFIRVPQCFAHVQQ